MPDIFTANKTDQDNREAGQQPFIQPAEPQPQVQQESAQQASAPEDQQEVKEQAPAQPQVRLSTSLPISQEGAAPHLFSSYCVYPKGITFINQESGEQLLLFLRRHFITNVPWIFFTFLFILVPPFITAIFQITNFSPFTISPQLQFVIVSFYYLVVANYALGKFIVWFYHVGIVTPKRLIDLDVDNILTYHLAETEMRDIVDVSYSQKGFFQSFFNFGNVPIQTEAIKANFEFEEAPHPAQVADIITDLRPHHPKGEH